jgi:hypothetical protein
MLKKAIRDFTCLRSQLRAPPVFLHKGKPFIAVYCQICVSHRTEMSRPALRFFQQIMQTRASLMDRGCSEPELNEREKLRYVSGPAGKGVLRQAR